MKGTVTKRQARVQWMLEHQHIWRECWPVATEAYLLERYGLAATHGPCAECIKFRCVMGMKAAGLISPSTNWFDVNIAKLIEGAYHRLGIFN